MKTVAGSKPKSLSREEKIRRALLGRKRPEEVKRKVSDTRKERIRLGLIIPWNKGKKGLQTAWNKGLTKSDPRVQKYLKTKGCSIAQQKLRELMKNPKWKSQWLQHCISAQNIRPNKLELKVLRVSQRHNLPLKYVGDGQVIIGGKCPDFIDNNGQKKIVEVFGEYWHRRKDIAWHQTEHGTRKVYAQYGFECLILWENELKNISDDCLLVKLQEFLKDAC
jgi:hypothetical protein